MAGIQLGLIGSLYGAVGDFESIATVSVGGGGASNVTFSSIPATYTHLQIRMLGIFSGAANYGYMAFNGDNANTNYSAHVLGGDGANPSAQSAINLSSGRFNTQSGTSPAAPNAMVLDILDYANTNKYKTTRNLYAWDANGSGYVDFTSGLWRSTSAITSIVLTPGNTFAQYTHVALYGIKG